jgi:adenylate cyclase
MRFTIGKKLNSLIVILQLLSIGGVVVLATQLFTSDLAGLLRKGTLDISAMLAGRVRAEMKHVADRARTLGAASLEDFQHSEDRLKFIQDNLATNDQTIGLSLYRLEEGPNKTEALTPATPGTAKFTPLWRIIHPEITKKLDLSSEDFAQIDQKYPLDFNSVEKGAVDFTIAKLKDGTPSLRMALPLVQRTDGNFSQLLAIELHQERLTALFSESTAYSSYLVDRSGRILGSTNASMFPLGESVASLPIIANLATNKSQSGQYDFQDKSGAQQMGAFHRVGFADLVVITQVPLERALIAQKQLYRRTAFLAGAFLAIALCLGFIVSRGITRSIQILAHAASRVTNGDFSVRLGIQKKGGDEIQQFSATFNEMVSGLQERDRLKVTFAKFHNKEIAEKLLTGELNLGGERKSAAIFFSDVRGFTAMSEKMEPEALVKILNRYMSRMVSVILAHGGIVDKYVGDAIMAVWGVPLGKDDDCERAMRACLEMRKALAELNQELKSEGYPALTIGMGLNYGPLISGNIGSEERMEYTVIGDTVNTASRIESLTKEMGTDLLVSKEILEQVSGKFIVKEADSVHVKGKKESLVTYKVLGYKDPEGNEVIIETPYSSYQASRSDKVVHEATTEATIHAKSIVTPPPMKPTGLKQHVQAVMPDREHKSKPAPALVKRARSVSKEQVDAPKNALFRRSKKKLESKEHSFDKTSLTNVTLLPVKQMPLLLEHSKVNSALITLAESKIDSKPDGPHELIIPLLPEPEFPIPAPRCLWILSKTFKPVLKKAA